MLGKVLEAPRGIASLRLLYCLFQLASVLDLVRARRIHISPVDRSVSGSEASNLAKDILSGIAMVRYLDGTAIWVASDLMLLRRLTPAHAALRPPDASGGDGLLPVLLWAAHCLKP